MLYSLILFTNNNKEKKNMFHEINSSNMKKEEEKWEKIFIIEKPNRLRARAYLASERDVGSGELCEARAAWTWQAIVTPRNRLPVVGQQINSKWIEERCAERCRLLHCLENQEQLSFSEFCFTNIFFLLEGGDDWEGLNYIIWCFFLELLL